MIATVDLLEATAHHLLMKGECVVTAYTNLEQLGAGADGPELQEEPIWRGALVVPAALAMPSHEVNQLRPHLQFASFGLHPCTQKA